MPILLWSPGILRICAVSGFLGTSMASSRTGVFWGSGYLRSLWGYRYSSRVEASSGVVD